MTDAATRIYTNQHWHVADHYTGDSRLYTDRTLMRQWVRRHGGEPIVEVVGPCSDPRCQDDDQ